MLINEIRKSLILTSSNEFIENISDYLTNGSFLGKGFQKINELFATTQSNRYKKNDEDFKYFYDKVAYLDYCKFNNLKPTKLASIHYLAASYDQINHEFSYSSNKFYKASDTPLKTILVLNVKGSDIYKVLNALYVKLRDANVDNSITIPSFNRFEDGYTDSIRVYINDADLEKVVSLIGDLPLPIINLIDKPNILYPQVNDYIGYDAIITYNNNPNVRKSNVVCDLIAGALFETVNYFIDNNGNELIEYDGETISSYLKSAPNKGISALEINLRILQRMVRINPSNKQILINNLKSVLFGKTSTNSAYFTNEDHESFNLLFGKLDDESTLVNKGGFVIDIEPPKVEVALEENIETENNNDIEPAYSEQVNKQELTEQEKLFKSFNERTESGEEYLDSLLASMEKTPIPNNELDTPVVSNENIHFYEDTPSVGNDFIVSSNPSEIPSVINNQEENSNIVKVDDMTDEQRTFVSNTLNELNQAESSLSGLLDKLSVYEDSVENVSSESSDELNQEEVSSLINTPLDQEILYEKALKYKDLVSSLSVLHTPVKGTDFTLLDYFDQQDLLSKVKPDGSYEIVSEERFSGRELVEECIIKYVNVYGNVPLEKIFEEYDVKSLDQKKDKNRGLINLFKKRK